MSIKKAKDAVTLTKPVVTKVFNKIKNLDKALKETKDTYPFLSRRLQLSGVSGLKSFLDKQLKARQAKRANPKLKLALKKQAKTEQERKNRPYKGLKGLD